MDGFQLPKALVETSRKAELPVIWKWERFLQTAWASCEGVVEPQELWALSVETGKLYLDAPIFQGELLNGQFCVLPATEERFRLTPHTDCRCLALTLSAVHPDPVLAQRLQDGYVLCPKGRPAAETAVGAVCDTEGRARSLEENSAAAYQFLMYLRRFGVREADAEANTLPAIVQAALGILEEDFAHLAGIDELADRLEISQSYLVRQFSNAMGISPGKYLRQRRIAYAKVLLTQPDMTVSLAAELSGFSCSNYFTKVFHKMTGVVPSQYAEAHRLPADPHSTARIDEIYL